MGHGAWGEGMGQDAAKDSLPTLPETDRFPKRGLRFPVDEDGQGGRAI